jgi:hypothetical protein
VGPVDGGIDFLELADNIGDRELGESAHLESSRVSREGLRSSKTLSRNPFYFRKSRIRHRLKTVASLTSMSPFHRDR